MRNFFALIGFAIVVFAVVGWYMGWYQVRFSQGEEGKLEIKTAVDTKKVVTDSSSFFQKLGQMLMEQAQNPATPGGSQPKTSGGGPANNSGTTNSFQGSSAGIISPQPPPAVPVSIPPPPSSKLP
jgi:hypothetical protein